MQSRGITRITYTHLHKPTEITFKDGNRQTITYDGFGNKKRIDYSVGPETIIGGDIPAEDSYTLISSRVYSGEHIFTDGELEYSGFDGGYFDANGLANYYIYDWQGNVFEVLNDNDGVIQATNYYPYGEPLEEPSGQPYLFGSKERDHYAGRNTYDYGARQLLPYGRWSTPDPQAELFHPYSPYSNCAGDPINNIDPDGEVVETVWDVINVAYDVTAAVGAHITGNHAKAVQHWIDAGADIVATVVPGLPAGLTKATKVAKVASTGKKAAKAIKTTAKTVKKTAQVSAAPQKSIKNLRRNAVRGAWKDEKQLVYKSGNGTRNWSPAEKRERLINGKVDGYQGHHINNVKHHPELAGNPENVIFVTRQEHLLKHGGNFRNKTTGPLMHRKKTLKRLTQ